MSEEELIRAIQRYVAVSAIGVTAVRGRTRGVLAATRAFAASVDLRRFGVADEATFRASLDEATDTLRQQLPADGQHWGVARKALNLFLRDALYNHYLRTAFRLDTAEAWFEVPLDSIVAAALAKRCPQAGLPPWGTVKGFHPPQTTLTRTSCVRWREH